MANEESVLVSPDRQPKPVRWYRSPIDPATLKALQVRSNLRGGLQTATFLGVLLMTGSMTVYSTTHWPWWATLALLFVHGTCFAFQINAVHELGHGTVFRNAALNSGFQKVFGFLGWINVPLFNASHARHHQFTLHPRDLEVPTATLITLRQFLRAAVVDPSYLKRMFLEAARLSHGNFQGDWELTLFPPDDPKRRQAPIQWARVLLAGHSAIIILALLAAAAGYPQWLLLPLLTTFGKCYGAWLFFSCNNTQHSGVQANVADYRLNSRSFQLHPVVRILYWHMNFHIEHHMYTQVPCYRLHRLQQRIAHDLPPAPKGILATWRDIKAAEAAAR